MAAYGNMEKGLPGLLYGMTHTHRIDSRAAKGEVPFGAVVFGVGDGEQAKVGGEGAPLGIASRTAYDYPGYRDGDSVNVVRTGKVWATAGEAIEADSEVSVNGSTGEILKKTAEVEGKKRELTLTFAGEATAGSVATIIIGSDVYSVTAAEGATTAADVAARFATEIDNKTFEVTAEEGALKLTAISAGVAANGVSVSASTTDTTQTITKSGDKDGEDVIVNPGWFVRSTAEAKGDLVIVDLG